MTGVETTITGFRDRADAGAQLAQRLLHLRGEEPVVIALPRGGVPVAHEIATTLGAPLDVLAVRKIGAPGHPEFGVGAIAEDGTGVIDQDTVQRLGIRADQLQAVIGEETAELRRRVALYRGERLPLDLEGKTVIVVDDGVATGVTDAAALGAVRSRHPARVVLALPVCAPQARARLAAEADEIVTLVEPPSLDGVGRWYRDFSQVPDEEVLRLLHATNGNGGPKTREVTIAAGEVRLPGELYVPPNPIGIVLFAHGSGSSRHSPRNVAVARRLHGLGLATLLFDLLTEPEAQDRRNVFAVDLLGERLVEATRWVGEQADLKSLAVGYFGASTGAAAALIAAARLPADVAAVVSRGGRPDLAGPALRDVAAPTLLIVGGDDHKVLGLNRQAEALLRAPSELAVVPGAGHLFEEPGTLAEAAELAAGWFTEKLTAAATRAAAQG